MDSTYFYIPGAEMAFIYFLEASGWVTLSDIIISAGSKGAMSD